MKKYALLAAMIGSITLVSSAAIACNPFESECPPFDKDSKGKKQQDASEKGKESAAAPIAPDEKKGQEMLAPEE